MSRLATATLIFASLAACSTESRAPLEPSTDVVTSGGLGVSAATALVRCEVRTGRRSRISVDGNNLAVGGSYSARVRSGGNAAASPITAAIGDEAGFDFDSNPADIAQGATAISRTFIAVQATGPDVMADILNASGAVVGPARRTVAFVRPRTKGSAPEYNLRRRWFTAHTTRLVIRRGC